MSSDTPMTAKTSYLFGLDPKVKEGIIAAIQERDQLRIDLATARQQLEAARDENFVFKEIAELIGTIYVHGNFIAETFNERELEKRLRKVGCFWDSLESYDAHKFPELESRRQG